MTRLALRRLLALCLLRQDPAFDLAYIPQVFLPEDAFLKGLASVGRALHRGGWVSLPVISSPGIGRERRYARPR